MRKIMIIAFLAISLLLAACAPTGEKSLAGQGISLGGTAPTVINKGELFLLQAGVRAPSDSNTAGEILEYRGADRSSQTQPKIQFKVWSTGESVEYALSNQVNIRLGGKTFLVKVLNPAVSDSQITVDFNGDGTVDKSTNSKIYNGGAAGMMGTGVSCHEIITPLIGETTPTWSYGDEFGTGDVQQNLTLTYVDHQKIKVTGGGQNAEIALGNSATVGVLNVHVLHILYQNYAGGVHKATLCIN